MLLLIHKFNKLVYIVGFLIQKSDGKEVRCLSSRRSKSEHSQIHLYLYLSRMEFSHDSREVYIKYLRPIFY